MKDKLQVMLLALGLGAVIGYALKIFPYTDHGSKIVIEEVEDLSADIQRNGNKIVISKAYKKKILTEDFTKILTDAKATPVMKDGKMHGVRLSNIKKDSIYEKAGFKNGDLIEEINGKPLNGAANSIRILETLKSQGKSESKDL